MEIYPKFRMFLTELDNLDINHGLSFLALHTLGIEEAELSEIFNIEGYTGFRTQIEKALQELVDWTVPEDLIDKTIPITKDHLLSLLGHPSIGYKRTRSTLNWKQELYSENCFTINDPDSIPDTINPISEVRIDHNRLELLILLPLSKDASPDRKWEILEIDGRGCDNEFALRIIFALTILGLNQQMSGDYTKVLEDLVTNSRELNTHLTGKILNPSSTILRKYKYINDPNAEKPEILSLRLRDIRKYKKKQFDSFKPKARARQSDDLITGLTELLLNTSGIICKIQLSQLTSKNKNRDSDLRIYAPRKWINHLLKPISLLKTLEERLSHKSEEQRQQGFDLTEPATYSELAALKKKNAKPKSIVKEWVNETVKRILRGENHESLEWASDKARVKIKIDKIFQETEVNRNTKNRGTRFVNTLEKNLRTYQWARVPIENDSELSFERAFIGEVDEKTLFDIFGIEFLTE
jgi:hypothetical protein